MKKFTFLLALFAMFFLHVGSAKGATVTLSYAGGTTNMTGNNDAALVGLDAATWSVVSDKGGAQNHVGLNKDGDIRLYAHKDSGNGNIMTVSISEGTIDEITLDIKANATYEVKAAGKVVAATNETTYTIGASSFSIQNTTKDASTQLKLNGITITYTSTGDNGNDTPDDGGDDVTPDDGGNTTPDDGGDDVTPDDGGDDVTPDDGGNTTPDDGGDDVTPDDGGNTTPDDGGDDTPLTSVPATMAAGENADACTVNGADGVKVGTSKKTGKMTITVPAGAKTLSFYAAAWNKVSDLSVSITPAENINPASITLTADEGIQGSATDFTLTGDESGYLFKFNLKDITKSTTFTLTAPKRFVVWNATYSADGTAGDDTPDDGGTTTPDTPVTGTAITGLQYADAYYYEYEGVSYYDIDMYKDVDMDTYEYIYPEVYISFEAKSKTALNGTYDVLYAGYWSSANDSVEIDEETYGTITLKNTDNEGNYSVQGSFVGTDGKTYTFNEVVNVYAYDIDADYEDIVLNETGGTDTPDTPGTDNPVAGTVTFDADVDKGNAGTDSNNATAYQVSKEGVTMEVSSGILGTYNNEMHYRIYKGQTLTITSTVGNIVSVEFTCTANDDEKYGPGCWTVDGGDYDYSGAVGTWTGNASSVVFTATTNQVRATQIVVKLGGTAVEDVLVGETPVKMIKNGQLMIIRGENTYNVLGAQMK